jgi:CRISPR system Cascade subunit CasE
MHPQLYLAQLNLNPRTREVRRDLADCQQMHRTLLAAFPEKTQTEAGARQEFGVLYRVEIHQRTGVVSVLVQSAFQPDWSKLPPGYLLTTPDEPKEIGSVYQSLQAGQRLRFRLRANPTKCVARQHRPADAQRDGKRVELRNQADQLAWLRRKAAEGGFDLVQINLAPDNESVVNVAQAQVREVGKAFGWREDGGQRRKLTLALAMFEGELVIGDTAKFYQVLRQGIGRGKAYGCGLLSLARA